MTESNRTESPADRARDDRPGVLDFAAHGDLDTVRIFASPGALEQRYGIPTTRATPDGSRTVCGSDGHTWTVSRTDAFFWTAERPRTDAERVQFIDQMNARDLASHMDEGRLALCLETVRELGRLIAGPRFDGRQQRMQGLAATLDYLMSTRTPVDMRMARAYLALDGLQVEPQPRSSVEGPADARC